MTMNHTTRIGRMAALVLLATLDEMNALIRFVINAGIRPEIGAVVPMHDAKEAFPSALRVQ